MDEQLHVILKGRVQGVGFRQATCSEASRLGITGWVRNRSDGRVEALFCGTHETLDLIRSWCQQGPAFAQVDTIDARFESGTSDYTHFTIRY
ncbi:MAG: acylphosphatase [Candidatus Hydrogenedentota bacterium]